VSVSQAMNYAEGMSAKLASESRSMNVEEAAALIQALAFLGVADGVRRIAKELETRGEFQRAPIQGPS
jgi:hypothetical protein